jgi:hypothetical protein
MSSIGRFISKIAAMFGSGKNAGAGVPAQSPQLDEDAEHAEAQARGDALERVIHAELNEHHAADADDLND